MPPSDFKDGTEKTGFVRGGQNKPPRECGNCIWVGDRFCNHPLVIADPDVPKNDFNLPIVDSDDCCDNFQSQKNVLIYMIRHGETELNQTNAFRGWVNVKLNDIGKKQAKFAAMFLRGRKIKGVYSSDLDRALETAKTLGKQVTKDKNLRPWDVGTFTGKSKDLYQSALNGYIDNPEKEVPLGESLKDFATRQQKAFEKYIQIAKESGPIVVVAHSSNCIQFSKQAEGKHELGRPEDVDLVSPGGVLAILDEDGVYKAEEIWGERKQANYGS